MPFPTMASNVGARSPAAGGGVPPNPNAIFGANLIGWWRADAGLGLSGADVNTWADQSPTGLSLAYAWGHPQYSATAWGGGPGIVLTNAGETFVRSSTAGLPTSGISALSVFAAGRFTTGGNSIGQLVSMSSGTLTDYEDDSGFVIGHYRTSDSLYVAVGGSEWNSISAPENVDHHYSVIHDGSNVNVRIDNGSPTTHSDAALSFANTYINIGSVVTSGGGTGTGEIVDAVIAEVFIAKVAADAGQRTAAEAWLDYRKANPGA